MLCIRINYLMGRVYAARFEDGDEKLNPEWPPHPSRLFSALVAAWAESAQDPDQKQREALEWLEGQEPPELRYGRASAQGLVTTYVPVNDRAVKEKGWTGSLVESRERKERRFPALTPVDPEVFFVWPQAEMAAELRPAFERLLRGVTSLGHSASLVEARLCDEVRDTAEVLRPDAEGRERLRVPYPGRLAELCETYDLFKKNPIKQFRPSRGETALYSEPRGEIPRAPRSHFREMVILRQTGGEPLTLLGTLQIAAALRGATLHHAPQPCPECLSGHAPGSTEETPVRSVRPHLAWVPLAHVAHRQATGRVLGVAALLPDSLTPEERAVCLRTVNRVREIQMGKLGAWRLEPETRETLPWTLKRKAWVGPSRHWGSVTPFVFDRYPRDPYGEEAEAVVAEACERIGLPRPISVAMLKISPHAGAPASFVFPAALPRAGKPRRFHTHVMLSFGEAVLGPLVMGAGRYYGYGLCRPVVG